MKTLIIANPTAGRKKGRALDVVNSCLARHCSELSLHKTTGPGDATATAKSAVEHGFEVVVAVGGDGSINEVASGLAGSKVKMGIIPCGTENVLARELGIPLDPTLACKHFLNASPHAVDLGAIGDRYFLCFAGIGFDAYVAHRIRSERKARLGAYAYFLTSFELIRLYKDTPRMAVIRFNGQELRKSYWMMLVGNIPSYGGGLRPAPRASFSDGLLDLCLYPRASYPEMLRQMALTRLGKHLELPGLVYVQAERFHISTSPSEQLELDGDPEGEMTPLTIETKPGALNLLY